MDTTELEMYLDEINHRVSKLFKDCPFELIRHCEDILQRPQPLNTTAKLSLASLSAGVVSLFYAIKYPSFVVAPLALLACGGALAIKNGNLSLTNYLSELEIYELQYATNCFDCKFNAETLSEALALFDKIKFEWLLQILKDECNDYRTYLQEITITNTEGPIEYIKERAKSIKRKLAHTEKLIAALNKVEKLADLTLFIRTTQDQDLINDLCTRAEFMFPFFRNPRPTEGRKLLNSIQKTFNDAQINIFALLEKDTVAIVQANPKIC